MNIFMRIATRVAGVGLIILITRIFRKILGLNNFSKYIFIVGAQKAGTTALFEYMKDHPMIAPSDVKECNYFGNEMLYSKGERYYRSLFPIGKSEQWGLDATPNYLFRDKCSRRIHDFSPDSKIIVLMRDPASRAFSAFNMYRQLSDSPSWKARNKVSNKDARDFFAPIINGSIEPDIKYFLDREMDAIKSGEHSEEPSLIRRGIYAPQIARYVELFGRDNVLLLFSEDLKGDREKTVNKVFNFIGLEPMSGAQYPLVHARSYASGTKGKEIIQKYAQAMFEHDKQELKDNYGLDVPW